MRSPSYTEWRKTQRISRVRRGGSHWYESTVDVRSVVRYSVAVKEMPISLRLDKELRKALEELAARDLRTVSDYIRVVLIRHVEKSRKEAK